MKCDYFYFNSLFYFTADSKGTKDDETKEKGHLKKNSTPVNDVVAIISSDNEQENKKTALTQAFMAVSKSNKSKTKTTGGVNIDEDIQRMYVNWTLDPGLKREPSESEIARGLEQWAAWRVRMNHSLIVTALVNLQLTSDESGNKEMTPPLSTTERHFIKPSVSETTDHRNEITNR